jgi:hypothetical protein
MPNICAKDGRALKIVQNSVIAEEWDGARDAGGQPYRVFYCDLWACPTCGTQILVTADQSVAQQHEDRYRQYADRAVVKFY